MLGFLLRRVVLGAIVLVLLSMVSFCFFTFLRQGGDLHLLVSTWWVWAKGLWGGDTLHTFNRPTFGSNYMLNPTTVVEALGHTAALLGLTLIVVVSFSVLLALVAAASRGTALDVTLRAFSYAAWAVPAFLLAMLVQLLVTTVGTQRGIGPFPIAGWPGDCPAGIGLDAGHFTGCAAAGHGARLAWNVLRYVTLPALTLGVGFVGLHARYLRSALLETLDRPFITTARAKGLAEPRVLVRHALRTSLATFVGAVFSDFGAILGSAMAVDYLFQLNGLGTLFISSFPHESGTVDPNAITPVILLTAVLVIVFSVFSDVAVARLDPRTREAE
ncbi:MAG: ABC transporter permease [Gaiellaceae bacterium]